MKVLVVDDEKDMEALFLQRFRKEIRDGKVQFAFALSAEDALKYLDAHNHETVLILSDINMPGMSGLELLHRIKQNNYIPPPVVMMITAYGDSENFTQAMKLGADDFLTKPLDFNLLKRKAQIKFFMAKILVADDEVDLEMLIKQKFRRKIREHKYEFVFALNGKEALQKVEEHPDIDVVLTDINMPEMDGLVLLEKLSEKSPLIKTVIVSAYGDMENIRTAMNRGAFDFVCKPVDFLDLELTIEKTLSHVAELKRTLQAIKENNILRMYVDETVLKFMNRREFESTLLSNETIEATVAFIDICCFTSISENEPADVVVNLLNKYFDMMVKEIIVHDGYVDKFMGDAIMAVFRGEYHLDRAIEACLAVRKRIDELPVDENNLNFSPKVSIGINSGEVISGNIGSADLRRLDYTVIGDVVNTAQRLQSVAEEGQLIIDESSYLKVKEFFNCRMVKEVTLKNKRKPVRVYEVLA